MMCVSSAKKKLVAIARAEIGYHEGAGNQTKYADDPNIARLYGWVPQGQPWCCTFVNWAFMKAFGYDIGSRLTYGGTAACANSAQLFRQHGAFVAVPEIGDQIFFYASGGINHTGIVVSVSGGTVQTVEGNYSDRVGTAFYPIASSKIAGYGRPCWEIVDGAGADPEDKKEEKEERDEVNHKWRPQTLTMSDAYKTDCVVLQSILNARKFACGSADGIFGPKTQASLNAAQAYFGLPVDGVCGPKTWGKLLEVTGG